MDRENQIEEIAKTMHDGCSIVNATNQCRGEDCLDCGAVTLYEKGYRKQSEVVMEIFDEIEKLVSTNKKTVGCATYEETIFYIEDFIEDLAELKKKYTGEKEDE